MKLKNILFPLLGVVLILGGLYLVFKPKVDSYFAQRETEEKIEQYESKPTKAQKKQEIPKDKSQVVGILSIPSVDIKEAVYPGAATPEQLQRGLAFAEEDESLTDQNISIAGHTDYNLYNQFTDLHKAKKGDKVTFKIGDEERKYKITSIKDVDPTQVEVLEEMQKDKDQLTLITCDDYDPNTGQWLKRSIYVAEAA
ncbi:MULTISPECIES: class A sortase SrtA [unclassified Staphylococcus]|uniref:class A sortase SrtA n=1 Tax=unclassified Staphylococcus TaxID=91994 RepID=UPI0021CE7533|nr:MULTISPECIES: class A sortase SrtA [unclassified Staphylococcus]UXR69414.1 class A sortase SrtA [Staphylococcus sp. IVB6246]UXR71470.1 class A sortase SrtA [Staphylococcus sp. IVB6240]UXR73748.1 class A sortase SrtA [Staphylococcus sp. IVB6238]UXR76068.1 class A sortase SrtA [Staphylococcus sp. IVB6233]UXR80266.1 class A sortase SrtA [Staphylococcus sp. IVB6218]